MSYIEEYKMRGTIEGYSEEEAEMHEDIFIRLRLKRAKGQATVRDQMALEIESLLLYNNVDHVPASEIFAAVDRLILIT